MSPFMSRFQAPLHGVLRWHQWDRLVEYMQCENDGGWYVYYVGETLPAAPMPMGQFREFVNEIDLLLRKDHQEDYLGIVYADDLESPAFLKIYDPNNLGSSCGSSGRRVLPAWTLSRVQPVDLQVELSNPAGRRRWWQRLFTLDDQRDSGTLCRQP